MKILKNAGLLLAAMAIVAFGASYKLNNLTTSGINTQGTALSNQKTLVVSSDATNEFSIAISRGTVTGLLTLVTNTFSPIYTQTPTVFVAPTSGTVALLMSNVTVTVTVSNLVFTGLSTNAVTGINNVDALVYGTTRSGVNP